MSFEDEVIDLPARMGKYRDAGYGQQEAARLARNDRLVAAELILEEDVASPVSVEIDNLDQIPVETCAEIVAEEDYQTASETQAILNACRRQGIGLNDTNYKMVAAIQNHLLARNFGSDVMPKMEAVHAEGISPKQLTLHMEDAGKFSLKEMWKKLKQSFIDAFNRIKSWYIKAFDASNRLGKKAAAVKATAENKQGAPQNNTFTFNGLKTLAINGKAPEPQEFAGIIQSMATTTQNVLGKNADYYNKIVENMDKALVELIKKAPQASAQQGNNTQQPNQNTPNQPVDFSTTTGENAAIKAITQEFMNVRKAFDGSNLFEPWTNASADERFKTVAEQGVLLDKTKGILPGDKMVVISMKTKGENENMAADNLKELKLSVGLTVETIAPKPREIEDSGQFRTLNQSQCITICDAVMEACKAALDYKLLFVERDKAFAQLGKQLEQTVNQADNLQGQALTFIRENVSACTTIFNKINSGEGRWYRYAMGVFSKSVDYAQQSMNQIQ